MKRVTSFLIMLLFLWAGSSWGQTTLISPTGDGGFENGATFALNGWTESNSANNPWVIGTYVSTAPFAGNSAYVSNDAGVTNNYTITLPNINYFYRDVTIPAGETRIMLSFNWVGNGESTWDLIQVFAAPTSITPVASVTYPGSGLATVPAGIIGSTFIGSANLQSTIQSATFLIPPSFAGTTMRLIFAWKSDTSGGTMPGGSIDNISLISSVPSAITSTALGGLWNSPATWVGGVLPAGDNVTIAAGAQVVVNQSVMLNNLTIDGKLQWLTTTTPSSTVNQLQVTNLTISNTGELYSHATVALGATVLVTGNFINDGIANFAAPASSLRFNGTGGTQTLGGTGTFIADQLGRGMIQNLGFVSLAACEITTTQNLVTGNLAHTAGSLNTNGKLSIDNTAICFGGLINRRVTTVTVNIMGAGYTSAPDVTFTAAPAGGVTATGYANFDAATGTVRSVTITNPGDGYRVAPTVIFTGGGFTTAATAVAALYQNFNISFIAQSQKSAIATITGGLTINSSQGLGSIFCTNGGEGYTSAPTVGFALPVSFINLVTNGGSGYTAAPTVTFSGGGGTGAVGTAVVCQGKVVSVHISTAGTGYTSVPTISLDGGGGTGATAEIPVDMLPTATANIDAALGMVTSFTVTNPGYGYLLTFPAVTLTGGGATVTAAGAVGRHGVYNLIYNWFLPAATNAIHYESAVIPANRRIHALTMANGAGFGSSFTSDITLYALAPLPTFTGEINMNGNSLTFEHPNYVGSAGSATAFVSNANITYKLLGSTAAQTRPFPFNSYDGVGAVNNLLSMGSAATVATEGSTITQITGSHAAAPTGTNMIGSRTLRIQTYGGLYGNLPTLRLAYNSIDALAGDAPFLTIAQATSTAGAWTVRSTGSGTGALNPAGGNRTTATTVVGPIVTTGDDYFGWHYLVPSCPAPTAGTNPSSTTTTATLDWVNGASETLWNIKYGAPGFDPSTSGTLVSGINVHPYTLNPDPPLTPSTTYGWYVKADCGSGVTSEWAGPFTFATTCDVASLPWNEGFEGATIPAIPNCWLKENGDWVTTNNANSTYDADARTGAQFLRESWLATTEYIWTPGFALSAGVTYNFSFWWAGDTYAGWTGDVFYNTSQNSTGVTQLGTSFVLDATVTTKTYAQVINSFVPPTSGNYYFAIRVNCPTSTPWYLSFDDFSVYELAYGTLAGTVTSATAKGPVAGAVVSSGTYSGITDATGYYEIPDILPGTYTFTCDAEGYFGESAVVGIVADEITTQDFALGFAQIAVNPTSLSQTLPPNGTASKTLTISNPSGTEPLNWNASLELLTDEFLKNQASTLPAGFTPSSNNPEQSDIAENNGSINTNSYQQNSVNAINPAKYVNSDATRGILWNNGPMITHPTGGFGGAPASALQSVTGPMLTNYGAGIQQTAGNSIADDFVVTENWALNTIKVYAYQTGSTTTSTITGVYVQIWNGAPNAGGVVVWGNLTTNRLASTTWSGIYRSNESDLLASNRPIMEVVANVSGCTLTPGTYWVQYQLTGSLASGPWGPPISIWGQGTTGNSLQLTPTGWAAFVSGTAPNSYAQGMPFVIEGEASTGWVSLGNYSGVINPGASQVVNVNFDATGLIDDTYLANINITHNGLEVTDGVLTVPAELIVASSTLPGLATNPNPAVGSTGVPLQPELSWTSGPGTSRTQVIVKKGIGGFATTIHTSAFFIGNTYNLADYGVTLLPKQVYTWVVNERNAAGTNTGTAWTFTTIGAGIIGGLVTDAYTLTGLDGVTITIGDGAYTTVTAGGGYYSIAGVVEGTWDVTADFAGYNSQTQSATVVHAQTALVNFALQQYLDPPLNLEAEVSDFVNVNLTWLAPGATPGPVVLFEDNFDTYIAGQKLACQNPTKWTTWSNAPCGSEDAYISSLHARSGANSVVIAPNNDLVKDFGTALTTGKHSISFYAYIPTGKTGYFNTLQSFVPSGTTIWGLEVFFNAAGGGVINAAGDSAALFTWPADTWFEVKHIVDLNNDLSEIWIGGSMIYSYQWTLGATGTGVNTLDANDFFGATANDQMYVDDYALVDITNGTGTAPVWLSYCNDVLNDAIGTGAAANFDVAARFTPDMLTALAGGSVTKVMFAPWEATSIATYTISIWQGVTPPTLIYSQAVSTIVEDAWNEVVLDTPVPIDPSQELWIGYNVNTTGGYPAGCDSGPHTEGFGNMINFGGWATLFSLNPVLTFNWSIKGCVESAKGSTVLEPIKQPVNNFINTGTLGLNPDNNQPSSTFVPNMGNRALTGYNIYRNTQFLAYTTETNYSDLALASGTYHYTLTGVFDQGESEPIGPASVVILPAPILLSAEADYYGIDLVWKDGSNIPLNPKDNSELKYSTSDVEVSSEVKNKKPNSNHNQGSGTDAGESCALAVTAVVGLNSSPGMPYWFEFTPTENKAVTISSCIDGQEVDTYLEVYNACGGTLIAINDDLNAACGSFAFSSGVTFNALAGVSYKILWYDYWETTAFDFTVELADVCIVECPAGAIPEGEVCLGNEAVDVTNGGCNSIPNIFTPISCGQVICGTASTYMLAGASRRDTDWYQFVLDTPKSVTFSVTAEFPVATGLVQQVVPGVPGCDNITGYISPYSIGNPCTATSVTVNLVPGTYYFFVGLNGFVGYPCGTFNDYVATVSCDFLAHYNVFRDGENIAQVANGKTYRDEDVTNGEEYCYTVSQVPLAGLETAQSNELCASVPQIPVIVVDPLSLTETHFVPPTQVTTKVVTVTNDGLGTLNWNLDVLTNEAIKGGTSTVTIGTGTTYNLTTSPPTPYGTYWKNFKQQYLYTAAELLAAGLKAGDITAMGFNVFALNTCSAMPNYTIYMKPTAQTALTTTFEAGTYQQVWYNASFLPVVGWNTHTFNTPFNWDGTSNIIIQICTDIIPGDYTQNASVYYTATTGVNTCLRYQSDTEPACVSTLAGTLSDNRANIQITGQSASWLSADVLSGTLAPGASTDVTVTFNSEGLTFGTHNGSLAFTSNDPVNPVVTVPVVLNVTGAMGTLTGVVTEAIAKGPISGVVITADELRGFSTLTGADGSYSLELPAGIYSVTASKTGYFSQTVEPVAIVVDQTITQNFQLALVCPGPETLPFTEDFESGVFPPTCWNAYNLDGAGTQWVSSTSYANSPTHSAKHGYSTNPATGQDGWLVTPGIDLTTVAAPELSFWEYIGFPTYYVYRAVYISTGSADPADGDFVELYEMSAGVAAWTEWNLDLSAYAGEVVHIAFVYQGYDADDWYIDDVSVYEIVPPTQVIPMPLGWSGWSSFIAPAAKATFADVVAPVAADMIITQYFSQLYWPSMGINTMGNFSNAHGYLTKMSAQASLTITGDYAPTTVAVNAGWNIFPVLSTCNVDADELLNIDGFVIAVEVAGNGVYYPEYSINTLLELVPGKAYYVKTTAAGSYTFPACAADKGYSYNKPVRSENITNWNDVSYTGISHTIIFSENTASMFENGDVIGAFTNGGLCAGMTIVNSTTTAMSLFADDISTGDVDGFAEGEMLNFRVMRPSTNEEFILDVTYNAQSPNFDGLFAVSGLSVIDNFTMSITGINNPSLSGLSIYPNPSTGIFNISVYGMDNNIDYVIMNAQGQQVVEGKLLNSQEIDLTTQPKGVYFIKFTGNSVLRIEKVVVK